MRRLGILLALLALLTGAASALEQETDYGAGAVYDSLPEAVAPMAEGETKLNETVKNLVTSALEQSTEQLRHTIRVLLELLLIAVFCQMAQGLGRRPLADAAFFMGTAALAARCISDVQGVIGLGLETVDSIQHFSDVLMPVMASAAAGAGATSSAEAMYAVTVLFSNLLIRFCSRLLKPMIYAGLALAITDTVLQGQRMKPLRELLLWLCKMGMKGALYLFTGFLSVTGVLAGSADAAALKAARVAVSGMVPVVGGLISDAAETVLFSAGVLKNSVGALGIAAVLAMALLPYLQIGMGYLGFRVAAGLCGLLESRLSTTLEAISQSMGLVLAMVGSCTLMNLLACFSFMRAVSL